MAALTLADLIANRTVSVEMAATLATAAEECRSLLFVAIPRMAGKSTVMRAALQHAPQGTPLTQLSREYGPGLGIPDDQQHGYLVVSEISPAGFPDYLWGRDVQRVFGSLEGRAIATALHAPGVDEAFAVLTQYNGLTDEQAARIDLVTYIRSIGPWFQPTRRVVEAMYEINGVEGGRPHVRLLHRWSEADDTFEVVDTPLRIGAAFGSYERYRASFAAVEERRRH